MGQPLSTGTYLALAALNRLVAPCSKAAVADWWKTTAADRFTKIPASALDHRRFWDAMHAISLEQLEQASEKIAARVVQVSGADVSSVALDMTNFATFIATANGRAPIAQRGKARQKRADLRLVGLGLVVTRDGGLPLTWRAYPGDRPDVTQFPDMIDQLKDRYEAVPRRQVARSKPDWADRGLAKFVQLNGLIETLRIIVTNGHVPKPNQPPSPGTVCVKRELSVMKH